MVFSAYVFLGSMVWIIQELKNKISIFIVILIIVVLIRTCVSCVKVALFAYMNCSIPNNISGRVISVREWIKAFGDWFLETNKSRHKSALGFPFNYAFTFYLISGISFVAIFTAVLLDGVAIVTEREIIQDEEGVDENQQKEGVNKIKEVGDLNQMESTPLRRMKKWIIIPLETVNW